jgi:hypothetical protein
MKDAQGLGFGRAKIAGGIHFELDFSLPAVGSDLDARPFRRKRPPVMKGTGQLASPASVASLVIYQQAHDPPAVLSAIT